jgi:Ni/Co efflux regulator RcnB
MQTRKIAAALMVATMGFATLASAQPRDDRDHGRGDRGGPPPGQMRHDDRGRPGPGGPGGFRHDGPGAGPDHRFYRGDRLPPEYRNRSYVVDDWRSHRLSAPPRGYQWVQVGGDYVLAAIATGIIANLILNQ